MIKFDLVWLFWRERIKRYKRKASTPLSLTMNSVYWRVRLSGVEALFLKVKSCTSIVQLFLYSFFTNIFPQKLFDDVSDVQSLQNLKHEQKLDY